MECEWWFQKASALAWCLAINSPACSLQSHQKVKLSETLKRQQNEGVPAAESFTASFTSGLQRSQIKTSTCAARQANCSCSSSLSSSVILRCWKWSSFLPGLLAATGPETGSTVLPSACLTAQMVHLRISSRCTSGPAARAIHSQLSRNSFPRLFSMKRKSTQKRKKGKCEESPHQIKREDIEHNTTKSQTSAPLSLHNSLRI